MAPRTKPDDPQTKYLKASYLKRRLGIGHRILQRLITEGKLPEPFHYGARSVMFERVIAEPMIVELEAAAAFQKRNVHDFLIELYPDLAKKRPKY